VCTSGYKYPTNLQIDYISTNLQIVSNESLFVNLQIRWITTIINSNFMPNIKGVFKKKNVIVAGGAGFIGSYLCEEIIMQGDAKVICIDNLVSGSVINIERLLQSPDFKFIRHDISAPIDLLKYPELGPFEIEFEGIQEIYNCATPTSYKDAKKLAVETIFANSYGTKNLLDLAKQYSAKLTHLSSSAIYGDPLPENKYFKEDYWGFIDPVGERAVYNEGKRFAETLCVTYRDHMGVEVHIARVFSTYGPRMIMDEGRHVPDFVTAALDNKDIVIYGDKEKALSFCNIKDMVEGIMKLMSSRERSPINLGSPEEIKLVDVAQKVIDLTGSKSKIVFKDEISNLQDQGLPDIKRAKESIGWFPIIKLAEGLKDTIEYMRSARSRYEQEGLWDQSTLDKEE